MNVKVGDQPTGPPLHVLGATPDGPVLLLGMRCACGHVAFPRQRFGCERCGRVDGIADVELVARGTVATSATVHLQLNTTPAVPFTVGVIRLEDGPVVRAFLDPGLKPGETAIGLVDVHRPDDIKALSFVSPQSNSGTKADAHG